MVRDQNTPNSLKLLFITSVAIIVLCVTLVMLYLSARQTSFSKTQPYNVSIQLRTNDDSSQLIAAYDYGYGFNPGHQQVFDLHDGQAQTINFSVSAWMKMNSLRLNSNSDVTISSVVVKKNGLEYSALDTDQSISEQAPLLLSDINHKLLGMN